jgi:hypothetical protein
MPRRSWIGLALLVAWTVFVWSNRLVNAWSSQTEGTGDKVVSSVLAGVLVAGAAAGVIVLWRTWSGPLTAGWARAMQAFAGLTVAVWAVRVPQIFLADHELGFELVHAALGAIAIGLAVWVWRAVAPVASDGRRRRPGADGPSAVGAGLAGDAGPTGSRH